MSTAFQNATIIFKNVWREAVELLLEQTSKEHSARERWLRPRKGCRGPWHDTALGAHRTRGTAWQASRAPWVTLGNSSNTCVGPGKEVEIPPVGTGGTGRKWLGDRPRASSVVKAACLQRPSLTQSHRGGVSSTFPSQTGVCLDFEETRSVDTLPLGCPCL